MQNKKQDSAKHLSTGRIIRKYYLGFTIVMALIFLVGPSPLGAGSSIWMNAVVAILVAGIFGTVYFLRETKWLPSKRKKLFSKSPFKELLEHGFTRYGDVAVGGVDSYTAILAYSWSGGQSMIKMDIIFGLGFHVHDNEAVLKDIIHRNPPANRFSSLAHEWTMNSIGCKFEYFFKPPSYDKLIKRAGELTAILRKEQLVPLSLEDIMPVKQQPG